VIGRAKAALFAKARGRGPALTAALLTACGLAWAAPAPTHTAAAPPPDTTASAPATAASRPPPNAAQRQLRTCQQRAGDPSAPDHAARVHECQNYARMAEEARRRQCLAGAAAIPEAAPRAAAERRCERPAR